MRRFLLRFTFPLIAANVLIAGTSAFAAEDETTGAEDERTLKIAGLNDDGPALLAFFQARTRIDIPEAPLSDLLRRFADGSDRERSLATAEFLGLGPLSIPTLRRAANDLQTPEVAERAERCLQWIEGPSSATLPIAVARVLAMRRPNGSAATLLDYLPFADNAEVVHAVTESLIAMVAHDGKSDPALLRGLTDPLAVRRVAAAVALCRATPLHHLQAVRKLLNDPAQGVRLAVALALAEAHDAEAVPILIDLLADVSPEQRQPVEELLRQLAGEWSPPSSFHTEDAIARKIRRDVWAAWWRNTDGSALLSVVRKHTLTIEDRKKIRDFLINLGSSDYASRESASRELFSLGRRSLPQLREAVKNGDPEVSRRAKQSIKQIELEPAHRLPVAVVRLLAVRKPVGAVGALLAYLPFAEDESHSAEVRSSLTVLALRDGKLDPELLAALADPQSRLRATAAEALVRGGGAEGRTAVRKLLADPVPEVRLRVALALTLAKERDGLPVLIDLLAVLPGESVGEVEDALRQLAAESAPDVSRGEKPDERKKCRDVWAAWWKANGNRVDVARLTARRWFGYTIVSDTANNRVYEIDRRGKMRWVIDKLTVPIDAFVLPGNRVFIVESGGNRVSERDLKGNILWQKQITNPVSAQRLSNGHTFIATIQQLVELDREGKEVFSINNVPGNGIYDAYRTHKGVLICLMQNQRCVLLDTTGKQIGSFACKHGNGNIEMLPNGRLFLGRVSDHKVVELDTSGKVLREMDAPGVTTATPLPNGHVLIATGSKRVYELDRAGKVVWENTSAGSAFRARQR